MTIDNGVATEAPVKIFVMGGDRWRNENEWPLARTQCTKYYIGGGRANSLNGKRHARHGDADRAWNRQFTYDPDNPVPTAGGAPRSVHERRDAALGRRGD